VVVGTAGAVRYRLPTDLGNAKQPRLTCMVIFLERCNLMGKLNFALKKYHASGFPRLL
jgi:hypothetical protein